jgi:hypothetical protein
MKAIIPPGKAMVLGPLVAAHDHLPPASAAVAGVAPPQMLPREPDEEEAGDRSPATPDRSLKQAHRGRSGDSGTRARITERSCQCSRGWVDEMIGDLAGGHAFSSA